MERWARGERAGLHHNFVSQKVGHGVESGKYCVGASAGVNHWVDVDMAEHGGGLYDDR